MHETPAESEGILRARDVRELIGISETTLWRLRQAGDFPPSIRLTRTAIGWRRGDVLAWLKSREAR